MIGELHDLDERAVRAETTQAQPMFDEGVTVLVGDLVAMAMPFAHLGYAVHLRGFGPASQSTWVCAESHRAAHVRDVLLRFHQTDHRVLAVRSELAGVTVIQV